MSCEINSIEVLEVFVGDGGPSVRRAVTMASTGELPENISSARFLAKGPVSGVRTEIFNVEADYETEGNNIVRGDISPSETTQSGTFDMFFRFILSEGGPLTVPIGRLVIRNT